MRITYEIPIGLTLFDVVAQHARCFYDITNSLLKKEEQGRLPVLFVSFEPDALHLHKSVVGRTKK